MKKKMELGISFSTGEFEIMEDGRIFTKPQDVTEKILKHLEKEYHMCRVVDHEGNEKEFRTFRWVDEKRVLVKDGILYFIKSTRNLTLDDATTGENLRKDMPYHTNILEIELAIAQKETGANLKAIDISDKELPMYKAILELHEKKHGVNFK